ncbi:Na+/alanine symporter [Sebaldella termitidis]|jgi:AGCS family alanine or glycine:cation symporter|uniref:Amino acid carrier protein n=1 Tax=Sebaldella termitidis (strain ATCC 33386 / NCTC 11300) TaxID=526218 RepID=D1ANX2_SEBTE|nr:sodium:alanine symporter family protein [Sebaldella termitidis]ACZ07446.1 amino acid carrier protein [Sebaldella termitidis ATCC 33386]SUI22741.1 Na+/alanine symporter [Sebaldella termitidis]
MENFIQLLNKINDFVWGLPLIILLLGTGIYYTFLLKGLQFRKLGHSLYLAFIKRKEEGNSGEGDISHFQALMTALAGTVGTGNIAGVAGAISVGGPGALFWMWMTGFFGMATKYSEAVLAVKYRKVDEYGNMIGGPMYYLQEGLNSKFLGVAFAIFAVIASFGIGNTVQVSEVASAMKTSFNVDPRITGIVLLVLTGSVILGGIQRIGRFTSAIVPTMIIFYVVSSLVIIFMHYDKIIPAFVLIFKSAFIPQAAIGGTFGALLSKTIQKGVSRGIFSNESGLGSSPIAAAAAKTNDPVSQALVSMTQTFIDTIIVCTMTGLIIVMSGATEGTGAVLTEKAFSILLPGDIGGIIVTISLIFFAYSTILGWAYYGEKALEYLAGEKSIMIYRIIFTLAIYLGIVFSKGVWVFSDIANGLMALPNLIGLLFLAKVVKSETNRFLNK